MLPFPFSSEQPVHGPLAPLDPDVLDEAFRIAICLGATERGATMIVARAMRNVRTGRPALTAALTRLGLFTRVIAEARVGLRRDGGRASAARFPGLAALPAAEREVLALDLACALSDAEIALVLGIERLRVRSLGRSGRAALVAHDRSR